MCKPKDLNDYDKGRIGMDIRLGQITSETAGIIECYAQRCNIIQEIDGSKVNVNREFY